MSTSEQSRQSSPEYRLRYLRTYLKNMAEMIHENGYGGILNIFVKPNDSHTEEALAIIQQALNINNSRIRRLSMQKLVTMLTFGVKQYQLGIADDILERQSLAENIFQVVYQGFGAEGKGWRIGRSHLIDALKAIDESATTGLSGTAFEDFINSLSFDELDNNPTPTLTVVTYPPLTPRPITRLAQAEPRFLTPQTAQRVEQYLSTLSLTLQVHPSRFIVDNPDGHVIVNLLDNSYRWFSARNTKWFYTYQSLTDGIATPAAYEQDHQLIEKEHTIL